jgi:protein HOOK3
VKTATLVKYFYLFLIFQKSLTDHIQLKDEIDVLREESEKAKLFENQLQILKKRLEDHNDLKKQFRLLEERNAEYLKQNNSLAEEAKKYSGLKGQSELYKKELQELHSKLDAEMNKTVKIQFDYNILQTKVSGLERERDKFLQERDSLRETIDELRCSQGTSTDADSSANISREIFGENLRDKIDLLEAENKALREGEGGKTALSQLLDDANQRNMKLRDQLKSANQKILALSQSDQNKSDVQLQLKQSIELNEQKGSLLEQAQTQINNLSGRIKILEQEYTNLDSKYKKCVEKAKEVIRQMDPRSSGKQLIFFFCSFSLLLFFITEAALLDKPDNESAMSRGEEKLLATAFYNLGMVYQFVKFTIISKFQIFKDLLVNVKLSTLALLYYLGRVKVF